MAHLRKHSYLRTPQHSHTNITAHRQNHTVTGRTEIVYSTTQQQINTSGSVQDCEINNIKYNLQKQCNGDAACDDKTMYFRA
jgi:hypothetical protein